jgi:hypothetical protein
VARCAEFERDLDSIRLPRWGRVVPAEGVVPWLVVDWMAKSWSQSSGSCGISWPGVTGSAVSAAMPMAFCGGGGG